jgi:Uncharacterised nucleotidyltransferase
MSVRNSRLKAEEQMILWSAGTAARRQATRPQAERLQTLVDWSRITELLRVRRLLPTLGPRILELTDGRSGEAFASAVEEAINAGRRQGALLGLIAERTRTALGNAGISSIALKGPLLGEALYGDPGRRPSGDIDLLVAQEQLYEAVTVVRDLGYAAPSDYVEDHGLPLLHFALVHQRDELPPVELHWRIHWYEQRFAGERLLPPSPELARSWRAAPIDELAALLLFYARDGFIDLRLATDIGAWWDAFGTQLRSGELDETIDAYPELERALVVSAAVAEKIVGLPASRVTERGGALRGRLAARLANPNPHSSPPQLYADMGLIDGMLAPPGGFGSFVRRQVIPPAAVLRERARQAQAQRASSALGHGGRVLVRYALAMTRLLPRPERRLALTSK